MILYPDTSSELIAKLRPLLAARPEPYAANVSVSDHKISGKDHAVVINQGPEAAFQTLNTTFARVNIYSPDEYDGKDLVQLVRALMTGRGPGTVCDGEPFTFGAINAGPNLIQDGTNLHHWYSVYEMQSRGSTLLPA